MKQIIIGDIHGHDTWKRIIDREKEFDRIIFLGDYHDSFSKSSKTIANNFKEIVGLKNGLKDEVILLCGNHDYHYIDNVETKFSGYRPELRGMQKDMLLELIQNDTIQLCFKDENNRLYSHAGFSRTWWRENVRKEMNLETVDRDINILFKTDLTPFNFIYGRGCGLYGDDPENGPLWIRPYSLYEDAIGGIDQIIGHTQPKDPIIIKSKQNTNIYLNDMLGLGYYLVTNNDSVIIKSIKI